MGSSLAWWVAAAGAEVIAIASRDAARAAALAHRLGRRRGARRTPPACALDALGTGGADLLLLAVADSALPTVAAGLASRAQAAVVLHTSGSRDATVLAPLRRAGSATGGFHPLRAFPRHVTSLAAARGVMFAIDGDPPARRLAERLARCLGGSAVVVEGVARPLYHLGATLAAGGVVTLLAAAGDLARRLGLPPAVLLGYARLAEGAIAEARQVGDPAAAITGPLARGDAATIRGHLAELARVAPDLLPLYRALASATLAQLARLGPLDSAQAALAKELAAPATSPARAKLP